LRGWIGIVVRSVTEMRASARGGDQAWSGTDCSFVDGAFHTLDTEVKTELVLAKKKGISS
jgi:hypothetical protein